MRHTTTDPVGDEMADEGGVSAVTACATAEREFERPSRRRFFALGVSMAAASVAGASTAAAQQTTKQTTKPSAARDMVKRLLQRAPSTDFDPFSRQGRVSSKTWDSTLTKLVRRVTNGVTEDELKLAQTLGYNGYLNYQLGFNKIEDGTTQTFVSQNYPLLTQSVEELYNIDQGMVVRQLTEASVYRAAFSKRQLYERMVEFWSDHFNIAFPQVNTSSSSMTARSSASMR
jgi:hypothetical protein